MEIIFPRKSHVILYRLYDELISSLFYEEITLILYFLVKSSKNYEDYFFSLIFLAKIVFSCSENYLGASKATISSDVVSDNAAKVNHELILLAIRNSSVQSSRDSNVQSATQVES